MKNVLLVINPNAGKMKSRTAMYEIVSRFCKAGYQVCVQAVSYTHLIVIQLLYSFLYYFFRLNLMLAVFNLLPFPPLDGSRIFLTFLPPKYYFGIMKYEQYLSLIHI